MTAELEKKLKTMRVNDLRKEISKTNVKGYSKLKKNEIVNLMLKYPKRFMYLVGKEEKIAKLEKMNILKQKPKEEKPKEEKPKEEKPKEERQLMKKLVVEFTTKKNQKENLDKINKLMKESKEDDLLANSISKSMLTKFLEEEQKFKSQPKKVAEEPEKEPKPEPKKEISRLDKLQGDLKVLEKELSNMPSPRAAKTAEGARQIVEIRTKLSSKIANLKFKIFNEKQKQKK